MSEQEVRDGLHAAVSGEPPLSFDPNALMTKAQHQVRGRRALIAAGVATVGVAVAAVAVPTMLGTPRGSTTGQPADGPPAACDPLSAAPTPTSYEITVPPSASLTPANKLVPKMSGEVRVEEVAPGTYRLVATAPPTTPCPAPTGPNGEPVTTTQSPSPSSAANHLELDWPPSNVTPKRYTAAELNRRGVEMQNHLRAQFGKVVTDAKAIKPGVFQGEAAGDVEDGQGYLNAFTTFTINGVQYAVDIYLAAPGTEAMSLNEECPPEIVDKCQLVKQPDGSSVLIKPEATDPANAGMGMQIFSVIHYRNDGSLVRATGYNYDPTAQTKPTYAPSIPVTAEQLTALATDPALGL